MAGEQVRVGFVGAGGIVRDRHVPGLRTVEGVEFYGVVNRSQESSQRAAEEFGIERTYDKWEELVQDPAIDIVWIGAHPYMHRPVTEAALAAGKHVFTQARMAPNYADARAMYDAAEAHPELTTMISPPPHFMRGDRAVRKLISEGYIGEPRNVVVQSYADAYLKPDSPIHWRQNWDMSGLNVLDMGMMIEVMHRCYLTATDTILIGKTSDSALTELKLKPEEERRWEAEAEFIAAVRAGSRKVEPSFHDGLKYMEMTEAIFRSIETGKTIELPLE
jgi:predicted dehydrogenase